MSIVTPSTSEASSGGAEPRRRSRRRQTSHLKGVPETRALREQLKERCQEVADRLDKGRPLTKDEMEEVARRLLEDAGQPESYVGWTMVMLASAFWRDQVAAVPPSRRLFLLPHCLKHAEGCPADYDQFGLDCKQCGACSIADFRTAAEDMGYKVLVAEGSPIVLKIIVSGYVDAIVGVACLNVLEKAIDKVLLAGIPCMAVPLLSSDCRNTSVDEEWVDEMIRIERQADVAAARTRTYVHLMRAASSLFEPKELERLAPRLRGNARPSSEPGRPPLAGIDPIAGTEALAFEFLAKGGKHSRPFITLAAYDAMRGGEWTRADAKPTPAAAGAHVGDPFDDAARRTALAIETFHKASLVHDDIEDDDPYRYGEETLHRRHGTATAINVGDYLIGLGYRLVSRESAVLGGDRAAEILDALAAAHLRLAEGQGAELLWRDALDKRLQPIDALKIYALKTAPAFEVALFSGVRLAGPVAELAEPIRQFSRNLGVAFQILNDLNDWLGDDHNKLAAGGDVLGGRPTVLLALALEGLSEEGREELLRLVGDSAGGPERVTRVRQLYTEAGVFEKAHRLVDKHQERAVAVTDSITSISTVDSAPLEELRRLLRFLIDTVLERPAETAAPLQTLSLSKATGK